MSIPFATRDRQSQFRLDQDQTLALALHAPVRIHVHSGLLWLTVAQGGSDIWLSPGRTFDFHGHGLAVFEAVNAAAHFEVLPLPGWRARLWRAIIGPGRAQPGAPSAGAVSGETMRISRLLPRGLIRWF